METITISEATQAAMNAICVRAYAEARTAVSAWLKAPFLTLAEAREAVAQARETLKGAMVAAGHPVADMAPEVAEGWYELNIATPEQIRQP